MKYPDIFFQKTKKIGQKLEAGRSCKFRPLKIIFGPFFGGEMEFRIIVSNTVLAHLSAHICCWIVEANNCSDDDRYMTIDKDMDHLLLGCYERFFFLNACWTFFLFFSFQKFNVKEIQCSMQYVLWLRFYVSTLTCVISFYSTYRPTGYYTAWAYIKIWPGQWKFNELRKN